jgi:peptidoglycan/xylan/chitin deacetylase (PgdA/CDA1 family)
MAEGSVCVQMRPSVMLRSATIRIGSNGAVYDPLRMTPAAIAKSASRTWAVIDLVGSNRSMGHARTPAFAGLRSSKAIELGAVPMVLMYHSVVPCHQDPYRSTVSPQRLERQMRWLRSSRLRGVSIAELLKAKDERRARGLVGLTFDDGYQNFVSYAMPVLQRYGFTATVFVLPGRLGGHNAWDPDRPRKELLTADEIRGMADVGMEIGSHGLMHVSLPKADDVVLKEETVQSREILQDLLGHQVRGFCYPYGDMDARVAAAVQAAGYDYACAIAPSPAIGRYAIPRTGVHEGDSAWRLYAKWIRSGLRVGNRVAVRCHQRGS